VLGPWVGVALLALLASSVAGVSSAVPASAVRVSDGPSGLTGTVRDSVSGEPVAGALVAVLSADDHQVVGGAVADDHGGY